MNRSFRLSASALVLFLLTGCGGTAASSDDVLRGERAVVDRVIDGDTVDVELGGEVVRVRLLNIDTPETKDPDKIVECLGPEATTLLEELLPPGTVVGLEYDQERTDSYGRTLAGVFVEDGTLVNAEIARQGLGTPMHIAPNDRFLPPVQEAFDEAQEQQVGLLDPDHGCTIPARVQEAADALADAAPSDLDDAAGEVAAAIMFLGALDAVDGDAHPHVRHLIGLPSLKSGISGVRADSVALLEQRLAIETEAAQREEAEEQRRQAEADAARQAELDRQAEAERQAELDRQAEAARQAAADAARRAIAPAPEVDVADEAPSGYVTDIPGYTGPRCYAPGGKTYKPC